MRKNITLPAVLLIGLLMTCLTVTGQSKANIRDVGELKTEAREARLKAEAQEARFKAEAEKARLQAEAQKEERLRANGAIDAFLKLNNTAGTKLRAAGETSESIVTYSVTGEKQRKNVYTYSTDGWIRLSEQFIWDDNEWVNDYKAEYVFTDGKQTSWISYRWIDNKWVGQSSYVYAYDSNGNQTLSEGYTGGKDNTWIPDYKQVYAYDNVGSRTLYEYYFGKGNEWLLSFKYAYENGRTILHENYNEDGTLSSKRISKYDAYGNEILYEYYTGKGNEWIPSFKYGYEYDAYGNEILYEYYHGAGNQWIGSDKYTHIYEDGVLTGYQYYSWKDNDWKVSSEDVYDNGVSAVGMDKVYVTKITQTDYNDPSGIIYVYKSIGINVPNYGIFSLWGINVTDVVYESTSDNTGNPTKVDVYSVNKENNEEIKTFMYSYVIEYEDGLLTNLAAYDTDGNNNVLRYKLVRQYDMSQRIILQEIYRWNYTKNLFATNSKYVYAYDANENQTLYESYDGNESGNGWTGDYKYVHAYDDAGRETLYEYYYGNESGNGWIGSYKREYAYDNNGLQTLSAYYYWDASSAGWLFDSKTITERNDNGQTILSESLYQSGNLMYGSRVLTEYDTNNDLSSREYYIWNDATSVWRGSEKMVYSERGVYGNTIAISNYLWNINQWEKSSYTIYYPDGDQTTPIALKPIPFEVTEGIEFSYDFDLESLLPDLTGFGDLTYTIEPATNDDGVLGAIDYTEGATLAIPVSDSGAGTATIPVTITSKNYGKFLATIQVTTSPRIRVNIAATMEGGLYSSKAYAYAGEPEITNVSDPEETVTDLELDIQYENANGVRSETAPVNAGNYKLILSVPADNTEYVGSLSIDFTIEQRPIQLTAEDKTAQAGSALPEFTYKVTGGVDGETLITGAPALSSTANMQVAGTYTIKIDLKNVTPTANYKFAAEAVVSGTLTVTAADDTDDDVTPSVSVSGVSLNASTAGLAVSETFQLIATLSPAGADNQGVTWSTSNAAIATVANGLVTGLAPGTATITVTTTDGGYTATCTVTVTSGSVGTEAVSQEIAVFFNESTLTIDSPADETIAVYDFNGRLLFAGKKPQGKTVFTVGSSGGTIFIVKGSSGWTKKIVR